MCFGLHSKRIRNMGLRDKRFYVRAREEHARKEKGTMVNAMGRVVRINNRPEGD